MDVCVWISVYVCEWVAKEWILTSASLSGVRLYRKSSLVNFSSKIKQRAGPT